MTKREMKQGVRNFGWIFVLIFGLLLINNCLGGQGGGGVIIPPDTTKQPHTAIISQPSNPSDSQRATFQFICDQANYTFECQLDSGAWASCTSPMTYDNLSAGSHTFQVRAASIDPIPASYNWTIQQPHATITSQPANPTDSQSATFQFICDQANYTFECQLDSEAWASCTSPLTYDNLSDGSHTFQVRAKNAAGYVDPIPASYNWTIQGQWLQVTAGYSHSCAIAYDHTLWCWGDNYFYGELGDGTNDSKNIPTRVGAGADWQLVKAGGGHTCALKANGTLWCWGDNYFGELGNGTNVNNNTPAQVGSGSDWRTVMAGEWHTCGVKSNGTLWCWGDNYYGEIGDGTQVNKNIPAQVGPDSDWEVVTGGFFDTCAVKNNGTLWCWGWNGYGQLGDGTYTDKYVPAKVGNESDWAQVVAGGIHNCAVKTNGSLWCWGDNEFGQLGDGTVVYSKKLPSRVGTWTDWQSVETHWNHTCGVRTNGTLWCWGDNEFGELGNGAITYSKNIPTRVGTGTDWAKAATGGVHTCALKANGSLWCWGNNTTGQLGNGAFGNKNIPTRIGAGADWRMVSGGAEHTCAVKANGMLRCWGNNQSGTLGDGTIDAKMAPTNVVGIYQDWRMVAAGGYQTCAIKNNGSLWCWGDNWYGELGNGIPANSSVPTQVGADYDWQTATCGYWHTCAVKTNGTLWCWGSNLYGGLGDGTNVDQNLPTQVGAGTDWFMVTGGYGHTCAVKTDGTLWCWGYNELGQLGDGTELDKNIPTQVGSETDWQLVEAGSVHTCAVKTNGSLWCWGDNELGELGDGTNGTDFSKSIPTQIGSGTDWQMVMCGYVHTCAVKTDGSLWCWGDNGYGELGDASDISTNSPIRAGTGADWQQVGVGGAHSCGVKNNGTLWCWGWNVWGQLGDGSAWKNYPVEVQ